MKTLSRGLSFLVLFAPAPVMAQVETAGSGAKPPVPVVKLTLYPAKAAVPSLKYRLLPELRDLKPGNSVVAYYRAFSPEWQSFQRNKEFSKWLDKWENDKTQPPPVELAFAHNFAALTELDLGARRAHCDWEMIERMRKEGMLMLLPDIQSFRVYGVLLAARARFDTLDKSYEKSLYTLQTGMSLGRHVSEGPTVIQALVGAAITNQMLYEVEQLIQQPGAPNLYWALTDLPAPFIDLRKPLQGERLMIDAFVPGWREMLANPHARPLSPEELESVLMKNIRVMQSAGIRPGTSWELRPMLALFAAKSYPEARKFLLEQGRPKELVDAMPVTQAALLFEIHNFDRLSDELVKWYGQPYPTMRKGTAQAVAQLKAAKANLTAGTFLATLLVPAVEKVFETSYRIDRKLAGLRCVEAIRLYAAEHNGKLPTSLKDIVEVPVPPDPYTGQSFEYILGPDGAILTAPTLPGSFPQYSWTMEITMQSITKRSNP